jgi:hypothetical protein
MLLSIGEIVDKLIIENIKVATLKERLNKSGLVESDEEYVLMYQKMMALNTNRATITKALEEKIQRVASGEKNSVINQIKTYE